MPREVTCVTADDADYEDCRSITKLGYVDPMTGRQKQSTPEQLYDEIESGRAQYYLTLPGGGKAQLVAVDGDEQRYVRAARDEDTPQDPLLRKPSC